MTEEPCTMVWGGYDPENQTPTYTIHESVHMIACVFRYTFDSSQTLWYVCDEDGEVVFSHHDMNPYSWAKRVLGEHQEGDTTSS